MKLDREDIHLISQLSNWSQEGVTNALEEHVYSSTIAWKKFLRITFLCLAVGFTTAGIIFFFAYNWAGMNKFVKLGIAETVLMAAVIVPYFLKIRGLFKKIILTAAAVLVGVLFALFGQIYQTGATAFDFFLAWTVFISIWVFISNFSLIWLLWLVLINATVILYSVQFAFDWSLIFVCLILFLIDSAFLIISQVLSIKYSKLQMPGWMLNIILVATVSIATMGVFMGIYDAKKEGFVPLIIAVVLLYGLGLQQAFSRKKIIYLAAIPMSLMMMMASLIGKIKLWEEWNFLFNSLFVVISIGFLVKYLISTQKKWKDE